VVVDDTSEDGGAEAFARMAAQFLGLDGARLRFVRRPLHGDFAAARNMAHDAARADWILHADMDERWDGNLLRSLPELTARLDRDGTTVCGFPRANLVDGVLVNDVPDTEWTEEGLARASRVVRWPPANRDIQFRLLKRAERWDGPIHERPTGVGQSPERVAELREPWILHAKSLGRQRRQDSLYRALGQERGMPQEETVVVPEGTPLRETVLTEVLRQLPPELLILVETGTLRDPLPQARFGDGWSTLCLAQFLAERGTPGSRLYTIDVDSHCVEISRRVVPPSLHDWVVWICDDSLPALKRLDVGRIDLLYLDSSDDPAHILAEFNEVKSKLPPHALVVVDDTGFYSAGPEGKGTFLIPELRRFGWRIGHRRQGESRMTVASRRPRNNIF
jgi:hypothetical protein